MTFHLRISKDTEVEIYTPGWYVQIISWFFGIKFQIKERGGMRHWTIQIGRFNKEGASFYSWGHWKRK
jgi:hypothetical protein